MPTASMNKARFLSVGVVFLCGAAFAQELTPRAYWPTPVGTDVLILAYQRNSGDVLVDLSLPISGVDSDIEYLQAAYQRSFDMLGRSASLQVSQAYADGTTRGTLGEEFLQRSTSGLGDTRVRLAVNLKGAPAMNPEQFASLRQDPEMIVGASVIVQVPTGAYDADKLINLGANRWSIKPALGVIVPLHRTWLFEAEIGVWIFGDNDNFLGQTREQDEIFSAELHLIQPQLAGWQRHMHLVSERTCWSPGDRVDRVLAEFPLPGASTGRPTFLLYLRLPAGELEPTVGAKTGATVRGFFIQTRGVFAGLAGVVGGTIKVRGTSQGRGATRRIEFELTCEEGSRLVGEAFARRDDYHIAHFETHRRPVDVDALVSGRPKPATSEGP